MVQYPQFLEGIFLPISRTRYRMMNRREFVSTTALMTATTALTASADESSTPQQCLELRQYQPLLGAKRGLMDKYLKDAAIPAWNRLGISPVGVFTPVYGQSSPTLYVLLPHPAIESVASSTRKMLADEEFLRLGADFLNTPLSDPSFVRYESSLMIAFDQMPKVEVPEAVKSWKSRIFEMRTYESHNEIMAKKKISMFNEGKEIEIFRKTNLYPVFFGETVLGRQMPNLTYMLTFENMAMRDANWKDFVGSPEWKELSAKEEYKDTVSNITDVILRPTDYSQI